MAGAYPPPAPGSAQAGAYPPPATNTGMYAYPPPVEGGNPGPGYVSVETGQGSSLDDTTPFATDSFSDKAIRRAFIRKVSTHKLFY